MSLGVLNNISAIYAQNNLNQTQMSLQNTLTQLSSGSRINSGADDAAGLALADGLHANVAALTQSAQNASAGVGMLQTADGALAQVTNLLNRAVTLATEAANGTLNTSQVSSADQEYQNILTEIGNIGSKTNYNGNAVFTATAVNVFVSDGTASGASTFAETVGALTTASVGTTSGGGAGADLTASATLDSTTAAGILTTLTSAVQDVAYQRGTIGANINQLSAAANVANTQSVNLSSAENNIRATNYGQATSDMAKFKILSETGIAALSQANAVQQDVLKLLQ
ncbi:flagellin [Edaphobacter sp. 12200R-103]|jgi:flagellin|uniref:flagellin N-terminal helical domain-containing protein n=1 Tax=Edaphobacter sp. 12200R-103 TaxID=2703788 RepID=UPI00138D9178|nr:flagellin [Edaphobacter sp. 12200R-103]QHS51331.1 flagellin [Edaphobacter sp. 12200R-103]